MHVWNNKKKKKYALHPVKVLHYEVFFFFFLSLTYVHVGLYREELGSLVKTMIFCQRNQPTVVILICVEVVWVWLTSFLFSIFLLFFLFKRWDKVAMGLETQHFYTAQEDNNFSLFAAIVAFCHLAYFFPFFWLLC